MILCELLFILLRHLRLVIALVLLLTLLSLIERLPFADLRALLDAELAQSRNLFAEADYRLSLRVLQVLWHSPFCLWIRGELPAFYGYCCLILARLSLPLTGILRYLPGWIMVVILLCLYLRDKAQFAHRSLALQKYLSLILKLTTFMLLPLYVLQPFWLLPSVWLGAVLYGVEILLLPVFVVYRQGLTPL